MKSTVKSNINQNFVIQMRLTKLSHEIEETDQRGEHNATVPNEARRNDGTSSESEVVDTKQDQDNESDDNHRNDRSYKV